MTDEQYKDLVARLRRHLIPGRDEREAADAIEALMTRAAIREGGKDE